MDREEKESQLKQAPNAEVSEPALGQQFSPPTFAPTSKAVTVQKKDNPDVDDKKSASTNQIVASAEGLPNSNPNSNSPFQLKTENSKTSNTNLPPNLQSNMEAMSGIGLGDVKVHQNSSAPGELGAHAFAQGSDIHIAPGQEKHLPHEAWHVVQQKQGRVNANTEINGAAVNDNPGLENEADQMGEKAASSKLPAQRKPSSEKSKEQTPQNAPAQLAQRNRKKNKKKKKKKKKNRNRNRNRNQPQVAQAPAAPAEKDWFEDGTYSGALASMFTGWSVEEEEEDKGFSFLTGIKGDEEDVVEGMTSKSHSAEGSIGDEEEEGGLIDSLTINLITHKGELGNGAETELSGGISADGFKGSGEIEIKAAKEGKIVKDGFVWDKTDGLITTKSEGEIEGFAGAKAEGEGEVAFNPLDYSASASGKASAFAGLSAEGSVNVNVLVDGKKAFAGKGTLGATAGIGLEAGFHISWEGGTFKMGGKGKAALGVGFSGGYEINLHPMSFLAGLATSVWKLFGY